MTKQREVKRGSKEVVDGTNAWAPNGSHAWHNTFTGL